MSEYRLEMRGVVKTVLNSAYKSFVFEEVTVLDALCDSC